jgi:Sec-independent protein translocase protein TatA
LKIRSREINIFSMSALDLFASALGAFMILTVAALPFFPNTGDSPELVAEVAEALSEAQQQLEQIQEELQQSQSELSEAQEEVTDLSSELARISIPELDIVICLDVSGSMGDYIAQMKQQIADLVTVLDRLSPSVGIGFVTYGDRLWQDPISFQQIYPTSNLNQIQAFINNTDTNMGLGSGSNDDVPEALSAALNQAVVMNWRNESQRRYIIVITDAPAYPELLNATFEAAQDFSATTSPEHYVSTVMVGSDQAEEYLRRLAQSGQGEFIDSTSGQSMLASIIMAIVTTI